MFVKAGRSDRACGLLAELQLWKAAIGTFLTLTRLARCATIILQVHRSQKYLDIFDDDQGSTDTSDGPVICTDEGVPQNYIIRCSTSMRLSKALLFNGLKIVTKAWLEDVVPIEGLNMRLVRHVGAEAISGGRHAGTPVPFFCNPKV